MSVKFAIGNVSGNGLKTVTSWPLRANSFINAECTVMWLLAGMGNIPRILAPSVAYRQAKNIMSICSFHCRYGIMLNGSPNIIFLWAYIRFPSLQLQKEKNVSVKVILWKSYNPEHRTLHSHSCEKLNSNTNIRIQNIYVISFFYGAEGYAICHTYILEMSRIGKRDIRYHIQRKYINKKYRNTVTCKLIQHFLLTPSGNFPRLPRTPQYLATYFLILTIEVPSSKTAKFKEISRNLITESSTLNV
jgi:hypothetical protein